MNKIEHASERLPEPQVQDELLIIDDPIIELGGFDFDDDFGEMITPPRILLACEEVSQPEKNKLSSLKDVIWDDVHALHPMLDFKNGVAYVAVNLDFDAPPLIESCPFTVTSDGSFFKTNDLTALAERGLRYSRELIAAPSRWKKSHLKDYLEGNVKLESDKLFTDLRSCFQRYVHFEDETTYSFMALWIIGTYLHPIFDAFPMVLLCGPKGSGKTRTLQVASLLAFNARLQGDPTPATVYRVIDEERPTLIFDEMEWLSRKDLQSQLSAILKFGYKPGCKVPRCAFDAKRNAYVVYFDAYCPKMFANIHGLEDVLGDRAVTFYQRRKTVEHGIESSSPSEDDPMWARLRHYLYVFMLAHWQDVKLCIPKDDVPLQNRNLELFSGVLALARFFEDQANLKGLYDTMLKLALEKAEEKKESDKELSHESILIQALLSLVKDSAWYSLSDIINEVQKFFSTKADWINDIWTGRALTRLGIGKISGTKGRKWGTDEFNKPKYLTNYYITRPEIESLAERYGIDLESDDSLSAEDEDDMNKW